MLSAKLSKTTGTATVSFAGEELRSELNRPLWATESMDYTTKIASLLLAEEGKDVTPLPLPMDGTTIADLVFNGILVIIKDIQREVDVYAGKLEADIKPQFSLNAGSAETPVRIAKGVIRDSCGIRMTDLCLRGVMISRHYHQWAPRDELWAEPFTSFATSKFKVAESSVDRSIRLGTETLNEAKEGTARMRQIKTRREEVASRRAQIVRMSTADIAAKQSSLAVVQEQASQRGIKTQGKKEEVFRKIVEHDTKKGCDDVVGEKALRKFLGKEVKQASKNKRRKRERAISKPASVSSESESSSSSSSSSS